MTKQFDWRDIVHGLPAGAEVKEDEWTATVKFAGIELRFQDSTDNGWELDEIVGQVRIHLEQMSNDYYWMSLTSVEDMGVAVHVNIGSVSGRAPVQATGWVDS